MKNETKTKLKNTDTINHLMCDQINARLDSVVGNIGKLFSIKLEEMLSLILEDKCSNHHIMLLKNNEELKAVIELFSWKENVKNTSKNIASNPDKSYEDNDYIEENPEIENLNKFN